jgi:hypothetical protein
VGGGGTEQAEQAEGFHADARIYPVRAILGSVRLGAQRTE